MLMAYIGVVSYCAAAISKSSLALYAFPILLLAIVFFFMLARYRHSHAWVFILIALPAVFGFGFFMLPGAVPDEPAHIYQCAALLSRNSSGFEVPLAFSQDYLPTNYAGAYEAITHGIGWDSTWICDRYLGSYFFHLYLIPGIILYLGQILSVNPYVALVVARIAEGLFFIFVSFLLVKIMPYGKTPLVVFLLNPMLIQQETSCSADAISLLVAISFIVYALRLNSKEELEKRDLICLAVLIFLLVTSKMLYAPLVLILFILVKRVGERRTRILLYAAPTALIIIAAIACIVFYRGSFFPDAFDLMRQPLHCVRVFVKSIWEMTPFWIESYAGYNLGALTIHAWIPCFWVYMILQFVVLVYSDDAEPSSMIKSDRVIFGIAALVDFFLILMTMRGWTLTHDLREDIIMGIQGRYLFPVFLPILLSILRPNFGKSKGNVLLTIAFFMVAIFGLDAYSVLTYFAV